jgi:hypothetical protein
MAIEGDRSARVCKAETPAASLTEADGLPIVRCDMADSIDDLIARGDAEALARLAESSDKATAKAARRGLHALRSRGVKVVAPAPRPPAPAPSPSPTAAAAAELPCLASSIDASGERALWLVRADRGGGMLVYEAYVHESHGVSQFRRSELSRKSWRKVGRELGGDREHFSVAEVPWSYARAELEEAYRRNLATGRAAPVEFLRARPQLGKAEPLAQHPALEIWPEAPVEAVAEAARLHELAECRAWIPEQEELERTAIKLSEVAQSQLVVDEQQRRAARADALARAVREYFADPARRARWRRRLLDTAYLLHQRGRDDDGALARAVAEQMAAGGPAEESPFAQRLFEKCFRLDEPAAEAGESTRRGATTTPSGLIVPP